MPLSLVRLLRYKTKELLVLRGIAEKARNIAPRRSA
jgi:hypothetical protein